MKRQVIIEKDTDKVRACLVIRDLDLSKPYEMWIDVYDPKHTTQQRRTYWMWIDEVCEQTGADKYGLDKCLRELHLTPTPYTKINGDADDYYKTISQLGKKELAKYLDDVWRTLHEYGYTLTNPEDVHVNS